MISKIENLVGDYTRQGSTLTKENITLRICPRKNTTPNKSDSFLVLKSPDNPKGTYISSLYQVGDGIYSLDYLSRKLRLVLEGEIAHITISVQL